MRASRAGCLLIAPIPSCDRRPLGVYRSVGCSFLGGTAVDIAGKLMLRRGDNADADCARRVNELAEDGDHAGVVVWMRIINAI